jgi:hypothetical protein
MNTLRAIFLGVLTVLVMPTASAQSPPPTPALEEAKLGGRAVVVRPPAAGPTPLVTTGNLTVGIWTRVGPPYDVEANRSAAANPLP